MPIIVCCLYLHALKMGEIIDEIKEKAKDVKDVMVDSVKTVTGKTTYNEAPSTYSSSKEGDEHSYSSSEGKRYEEGVSGTDVTRNDNPLTEYRDKEPMTPAKINEHEPTAVRRDPRDQKIASQGQTGTNNENANEQYRKRGMTKVDASSEYTAKQNSSST